jgi:hypothetical protein
VILDVQVLRTDEQANILVCEDLIVSIFHEHATGQVYETMHEGRELVLRDHAAISMLSIVPGHPRGLGTAEGRELGKASLARMEADLRAIAIVIEAGTLASSLTRTMMNTMSLVTQRRYAWKTFAQVDPASEWLAPHLSTRLTTADIVELAARVRALAPNGRSRAL